MATKAGKIEFLLIFDMDITLIDNSIVDFDTLLVQALRKVGVDVMPDRASRNMLWSSGKGHVTWLEHAGVDDLREFWNVFDALDYETRRNYICQGMVSVHPDVKKTLQRLQDYQGCLLALLTNTPLALTTYQLDTFDLARYFDFILALDMEGYDQSNAKPEPWGIHHIQARLLDRMTSKSIENPRTLLIGDSMIDMETAKKAGVPGIQILRGDTVPSPLATFVIASLDEITPMFLHKINSTCMRKV